jgi:hypothetical protein
MGLALILLGLLVVRGPGSVTVAALGLLPLMAGLLNVSYLFGTGNKQPARVYQRIQPPTVERSRAASGARRQTHLDE